MPVFYDSMIAKLVAWAGTRDEAIARMTRALDEYEVLGIRTTIPFFLWLMREPDYLAGRFDTTYLDRLLESRRGESFSAFTAAEEQQIAIAAALDAWFRAGATYHRRRPADRRQRLDASPRGRKRCASVTFEIEVERPRPHRVDRARRPRPLSRDRRRRRRGRRRASAAGDVRRLAALSRRGARRRHDPVRAGPAAGEMLAYLGGRNVAGHRQRPPHRPRPPPTAAAARTASRRSSRPMPGRVVRVLVAPGDEVERRQPVVVVEAMKMENELRSPKAGRVKDVTVTPGTSVEAGRVLVVIE